MFWVNWEVIIKREKWLIYIVEDSFELSLDKYVGEEEEIRGGCLGSYLIFF